MQGTPRVVLVDDDINLLNVVRDSLKEEFRIDTFTDPYIAMEHLKTSDADAIVMDYHIPGRDAFSVFQEIRHNKISQPVLFLTGDSCPKIKIQGLDLGVEDFLHKPISMNELSAHLKNRIRSYKKIKPDILKVNNLEINLANPEINLDGKLVTLTRKEFQILSMLAQNVNFVVKKTDIINTLWPDVKVEVNNLDTHLSNLRKKITGFTGKIKTIKSFGYSLRV